MLPVALIVASVLLQAGTEGFLSGRLDVAGSLLFSCLAFLATTVVFTVAHRMRRRGRGEPWPPERLVVRGQVRRHLLEMNAASALTFLCFYLSLVWVPAALAGSLMAGVGPLAVTLSDAVRRTGAATPASWARGLVLFAVSMAAAVGIQPDALSSAGPAVLGGGALAGVSGLGAACLAMVSRRLGALGVSPVLVTAAASTPPTCWRPSCS